MSILSRTIDNRFNAKREFFFSLTCLHFIIPNVELRNNKVIFSSVSLSSHLTKLTETKWAHWYPQKVKILEIVWIVCWHTEVSQRKNFFFGIGNVAIWVRVSLCNHKNQFSMLCFTSFTSFIVRMLSNNNKKLPINEI